MLQGRTSHPTLQSQLLNGHQHVVGTGLPETVTKPSPKGDVRFHVIPGNSRSSETR